MTTEDTSQLSSRVARYREEARKLLMQQSELYWRNWVYGDPIDITATYAGHERLFSPEAVADVAKLAALERDPDGKRALGYLRLYLVGEIIGRAVAPLSDKAANLEADATFKTPGGVEQPYRELNRLLANEVNYQLRGQLSEAALPVVRQLNPILEEKEAVTRKLLAGLGFSGYDAFGAALRQADLTALAKLADEVLTSTESLYRAAMEKETHALLGIGLPGMRRADIPRFNRSASLDSYFPANKLIPTLRATLAGMGIDLEKQTNIRIDDAPLPKKNPRAVCFAIVVPHDIRLSVKPLGGVSDYEALFHESGHAEHWAHTETDVFEFQQLGETRPPKPTPSCSRICWRTRAGSRRRSVCPATSGRRSSAALRSASSICCAATLGSSCSRFAGTRAPRAARIRRRSTGRCSSGPTAFPSPPPTRSDTSSITTPSSTRRTTSGPGSSRRRSRPTSRSSSGRVGGTAPPLGRRSPSCGGMGTSSMWTRSQ